MAKHDFVLARQRTRQFLQDTGNIHHMFYGPTSDEYWSAPLRILAVNMEPYGYEDCGHTEVDLQQLLDWIDVAKTPRRTFGIIRTLVNAFSDGILPTYEHLQMSCSDRTGLEAMARQSVYYNIRPTSNPNKEQDAAGIIASGSNTTAQFIRNEMMALEPHIIFVSGHAGLAAFNAMWQLDPKLRFLKSRWHSKTLLLQSIRHPSRAKYEECASCIVDVVRELKATANSSSPAIPRPAA